MAKKKRRPGSNRPNRPPTPPPIDIPDRRVMEGVIQQFTSQLQGNASPQTPSGQAQALIYRAAEERDPKRRAKLAHDALAIDADCADAYVMIAEDTFGRKKRLELYEKALAAAERTLGPEVFERQVGHFWGIVETRPYMRARLGLANSLWDMVRRDEAIRHLQEMLRLNPNDNQAVRHLLAGYYLFLDEKEALARLLERYDEETATWAYNKTLFSFRREGDTIDSRRLLKAAIKLNRYVPKYLSGDEQPPVEKPLAYTSGDKSEAISYADACLAAWNDTAGAAEWVRTFRKQKADVPEARGPLGFIKKWLTTHLPLTEIVWQADFRRVPNWLRIDGEFTRPWIILVANRTDDLLLSHELVLEVPPSALVWDTVMKAMQHPAAGTPHRPIELQVPPSETWESLKPHFEQVGIRLVTTPDMTFLDGVFAGLYENVIAKPKPALIDLAGLTPHRIGEFYDAAAWFFQEAPWKKIGYEAAIRLECDKFGNFPRCAVVMGQAGMTTGLALYEALDQLQKVWADPRLQSNAVPMASTALLYVAEWGISITDLDAAKRHGWPIARADAYPSAIHTDETQTIRLPNAEELDMLEICLRAVPEFVKRRRQDDPTREEIMIHTATGPVKLALSWVPEPVS